MRTRTARLKDWIEEHAPLVLLRPYMRWRYRSRSAVGSGDAQEVFTHIYRGNGWGDEQSLSGPGSNIRSHYTRVIVTELPRLVRELGCRTFLDAPCGDFAWMQHVDLGECRYIGADIVPEMIRANQEKFGDQRRSFIHMDIATGDFPPDVDLMMVRDCFIHLSFDMIRSALANIQRNRVRYLLASTYRNKRRNWDIASGGFRPVNLERPPFNLPPPERFIREDIVPNQPAAERSLGLWKVESLSP